MVILKDGLLHTRRVRCECSCLGYETVAEVIMILYIINLQNAYLETCISPQIHAKSVDVRKGDSYGPHSKGFA